MITEQNRIETIVTALDRAAMHYYHNGSSVYSDDQYDAMVAELQQLDPDHPRLKQVGSPVPENSNLPKVQNRASTNSLSKVDTKEDLRKWHAKVGGGPLMVELKADGMTILVYYIDGILSQVLTRGGDNGMGQDVTKNAMKFKGIKPILVDECGNRVLFTGAIRGEALMTTADYAKLDPTISGNVRNIGSGAVLRSDGTDSELITFLSFNYECLPGGTKLDEDGSIHIQQIGSTSAAICSSYRCSPDTEQDKIKTLEAWGLKVMINKWCPTLEEAIACWDETEITRSKNLLPHKIDGVVFKLDDCAAAKKLGISSGKPNSETVLKFEAPGAETTVVGIIMTVGHDGAQIPTASLAPVVIDKTIVKSAQLNNWEIIEALDIAIGDKVKVRKAKDIIPEIVSVVSRPADRILIKEPVVCAVCGFKAGRIENLSGDQSARTYCYNPDCSAKSIKRIENWIGKLDILGIGPGVLQALVEKYDLASPADLYTLTPEQLASVPVGNGILGMSNATKIHANINKTREISLNNFLGSLSIKHLGRRMVQLTREKVPGQLDTLDDWRSGKLTQIECGMPGKAEPIMESIKAFGPVIDALLQHVKIVEPVEPLGSQSMAGGLLAGKSFCLTGKMSRTRGDIAADITAAGGIARDDVSKGLDFLVTAFPDSTSSKAVKANKLGVKVISEQELMDMISPVSATV
jgi:DNA ligase (NAD+)